MYILLSRLKKSKFKIKPSFFNRKFIFEAIFILDDSTLYSYIQLYEYKISFKGAG